ncbi:hypothetical protein [Streptomyces sp. NPDC004589]|uniref:hypothetical protein n=1 Tax=Streptomyces sp. NPDC004589 TaxID=3154553 RepID=UPI0033A6A949
MKASSNSGVTREVSPTTSPGSSARASGPSPSVASRSPARNPPAQRCVPDGPPTTSGGAAPRTRSTAATGSPPDTGGTRRAVTRTRVEGSRASHGDRAGPFATSLGLFADATRVCVSTITRTGARVAVVVPSACVTRLIRASISTAGGIA